MDFYIYKHTSPTGKVYIGITSQDPERRWGANGSGYRENKRFYNAIKKHGWDNFKHEILFKGLTKEDACEIEKQLIKEHRSYEFKYGYNQSLGGEHGNHGDSTKKLLSEHVSKLWEDPEYRQHMSDAHRGQRRTGWHHTEESKALLSKIVKERCSNQEYKAKLSAAALKRTDKNAMSARAKNAWQDEEYRAKQIERLKNNRFRAKPVLCVETGEVFPSTLDAAKSIGVARETIGQVCRGERKTTHGFHWRFADE